MSRGNSCKPNAIYAREKSSNERSKGNGERSKSGENGKRGGEELKRNESDNCSSFAGGEGKAGNKAPKKKW